MIDISNLIKVWDKRLAERKVPWHNEVEAARALCQAKMVNDAEWQGRFDGGLLGLVLGVLFSAICFGIVCFVKGWA